MSGLNYDIYNQNSYVIRGERELYSKQICSNLKGRWYNKLKGGPGWIVSRDLQTTLETLVEGINKNLELDQMGKNAKGVHYHKKYHRADSDSDDDDDVVDGEDGAAVSYIRRFAKSPEFLDADKHADLISYNESVVEKTGSHSSGASRDKLPGPDDNYYNSENETQIMLQKYARSPAHAAARRGAPSRSSRVAPEPLAAPSLSSRRGSTSPPSRTKDDANDEDDDELEILELQLKIKEAKKQRKVRERDARRLAEMKEEVRHLEASLSTGGGAARGRSRR